MAIPGFTAEAAAAAPSGHYQLRSRSDGLDGRVRPAQALSYRTASGFHFGASRQGLGFSCGALGCVCTGDADCNDMFSTNVCGPNAVCFESGSGVVCVCLR